MRSIVPDVYAVGAVDWDRKLFDELIPLPETLQQLQLPHPGAI